MADSKAKAVDSLFDRNISDIIALLESGSVEESKICSEISITPEELEERLSLLLEHGFVVKSGTAYSADSQKLSDAIESSSRFDATIDKVTQMDSYLN